MKLSIVLAALTAITVSASPVTAPVTPPGETLTFDSPAVEVTVYTNGLPKELIPRAIDESGLTKRQSNSGIYACENINFTGYCAHVTAPFYYCVNIGDNLYHKISSVGPDYGYCLFYRDFNCQDGHGHFGTFNPGYADLTTIGFNDQISSYICHPN